MFTRATGHMIATLGVAACLVLAVAPVASAKPSGSGSASAKACQQGGWTAWTTSTGATFASQRECTRYAATGGTLLYRWQTGDLTTYNQTHWGGDPGAAPAAMLLFSQFSTVYPAREVEVGIPGPSGYSMLFRSASAVVAYLPSIGAADALNQDLLDPQSSSSGIFGGEVLALRLNVDFSDAEVLPDNAGISFGDLTMCNFQLPHLTQFNGMSVREFLAAAETALGGGSSTQDLHIIEPISDDLSNAFQGGTLSTFAREHLVNGPCP